MDKEISKYLELGKYTGDYPEEFLNRIRKENFGKINEETVRKIFKIIRQELDPRIYKVHIENDFKKSRFISARDVLEKRQYSCGSLATIVAFILRILGTPVKLIDGRFIKSNSKMKHAWNEIYLIEKNEFVPFDITKPDFAISDYHIKEGEYVDWEELES